MNLDTGASSPLPAKSPVSGRSLWARPSDIVALATSSTPWNPAVIIATALAERWGSGLTGCYMDAALRRLDGGDSEPSAQGILRASGEPDRYAASAFRAMTQEYGVARACWRVAHASMASTLRQFGAWHDLAVLERDMVAETDLFAILGEALLGSRMACMVLPPDFRGSSDFERIVIGWNGSMEAARAIHSALPFLQAASQVILYDGTTSRPDDNVEADMLLRPADYLRRHNVDVTIHPMPMPSQSAGEHLLKATRKHHADLLVMGAYSHSRLRERVLGGATRRVLEHAHLPLLIQH